MTAKTDAPADVWQLIDKRMRLGKIALNLEKLGNSGEEVVAFCVPFGECMLNGVECGELVKDKYFERAVFDSKKGAQVPCAWLLHVDPIKISRSFEKAFVLMTVTGDRELEFDEVQIKDLMLVFDPKYGGQAELVGKLYLRPGIGQENLILQEHQHHEVLVTITNARVMLKAKSKQMDLLENKSEGEEDAGEQEELTHPEQLFEKPSGRGRAKQTSAPKKRGRKSANGSARAPS